MINNDFDSPNTISDDALRAIQTILILMYILYPFQTDNYSKINFTET